MKRDEREEGGGLGGGLGGTGGRAEAATGGERLNMQQVCCGVGSPYQCICPSVCSTGDSSPL